MHQVVEPKFTVFGLGIQLHFIYVTGRVAGFHSIKMFKMKVWQDQGGPSVVIIARELPGGTLRFPNTCSA